LNQISRPRHAMALYEFFMLCLCVWALLSLATLTFLEIPASAAAILIYADYAVCGIFFLDFLRSLYRVPNGVTYMLGWGWIDMLSSIPTVGALRWGAARVMRILRVVWGLRSARMISQFLVAKRAANAFMVPILLTCGWMFGCRSPIRCCRPGVSHSHDPGLVTLRRASYSPLTLQFSAARDSIAG
jgi:hypothetical protein